MKCLPIIFIGLCLIVFVVSVPIDEPKQKSVGKKVNQVYKQAVSDNTAGSVANNPAAAAASSDEEDDEDDDDDEGGLAEVLVDDDGDDDSGDDDDDDEDEDDDADDDEEDDEDDDDEADEEGEDGDYLERFFDDILGDDEDEEYDTDESGEIPNISPVINTPKPEIAAVPITPQTLPIEVVDASSNSNLVDSGEVADEVVHVPEKLPNDEIITKPPVYELSISQDDDDDDDDFADGVIEARSIRRSSKQTNKDSSPNDGMLPSTILAKYNIVVDGVYEKLNRILKKMYDPINIQLTKQSKRSESKNFKKSKIRTVPRKSATTTTTTNIKTKQVNESSAGTKPVSKSKTRARGTMYGLSTLKRKGNIHVTSENGEDTIKSDFVLGPLVLKVSKSFSRGAKRELRSASAMTSRLRGRIILKVNDGTAVLHTIKIQQPKNIKIEMPGKKLNKSREMAWHKSLNIAHIVADQISTVSRTMLKL